MGEEKEYPSLEYCIKIGDMASKMAELSAQAAKFSKGLAQAHNDHMQDFTKNKNLAQEYYGKALEKMLTPAEVKGINWKTH